MLHCQYFWAENRYSSMILTDVKPIKLEEMESAYLRTFSKARSGSFWGQRSFWCQTRPSQAVWTGLCVFWICYSISSLRSETRGQTSQNVVKLGGHAQFEVRGHSKAKPGLPRQFGQVCVFSESVIVSRYLYGLDFGQGHAQTHFFDFRQWDSMLIPPRGVRSQSRGGKLEVLHFLDFRDFRVFSSMVNLCRAILRIPMTFKPLPNMFGHQVWCSRTICIMKFDKKGWMSH